MRSRAGRLIDLLMKQLAEDVSLGIAGGELREATLDRLEAEAKREKWEAGRTEGNANLDRYVADLDRRLGDVKPAVADPQRRPILEAAKNAWEALWHPAPEGCAEAFLHDALVGATRAQGIARRG